MSFELDFGGRSQWLRRLVSSGEGANVVARVPAAGAARRRLVLVAHHDTAHTGIGWKNPELIGYGTRDRVRGRSGCRRIPT